MKPVSTIEYERYVDGLRQQNALMRAALQKLIAKADDIISAIDLAGSRESSLFETYTSALSAAASEAERLLEGTDGGAP